MWCGNSVLEHAVFNLIITGVSRSFTHELIRHRHISPSQLSQRYVDESDCRFVCPPLIGNNEKLREIWERSVSQSHQAYCELATGLYELLDPELDKTSRRKQAREAARSVLPNATETKICITGNARAFRNLIELRSHKAAEAEIRRVAVMVWEKLKDAAPNLFGDYVKSEDGSLDTPYRKV